MALFKNYFYNEMIKRYTIAMGTMFNGISVVRKDDTGKEVQRVVVPVAYAPKEKFIMLQQDNGRQPAITLPRMAFELTMMNYDSTRKLQKNRRYHFNKGTPEDPTVATHAGSIYTPVPWDLTYTLYIATKTQDEMLQIVEQIIPAFTPDVTITMKTIAEPSTTFDVPINFMDITTSDSYEGGITERRVLNWTLTFVVKAQLFGPMQEKHVIYETDVDYKQWSDLFDEGQSDWLEVKTG